MDIIEKNAYDYETSVLCGIAVSAITDEGILSKVAVKYMAEDFGLEAFNKITDKSIRANVTNEAESIYKSGSTDKRKQHCVKYIEDQEILLDMVLNSPSDNVKTKALGKINKTELIVKLVEALPRILITLKVYLESFTN